MKVCDVCYLPDEDLATLRSSVLHIPQQNSSYFWGDATKGPDLCPGCGDLLKAKNWSELGKRHEAALRRLLDREDHDASE